ncbi:MAG: biotin--[acetyl-CoA-carboxylase] ligase [Sulfuriferula sp.]
MNPLLLPLLHVLSDGEFHSGEVLAQRFGVSRASVWNALQAAQEQGIVLNKVRGRGYRLPNAPGWLDAAAIKHALGTHAKRFNIQVAEHLDSTNTELMRAAANGAPHRSCLVAEMQLAGRGRRGRVWQSVLGGSLACSVLWRFDAGVAALSGLSLAVGVALLRTLRQFGADTVQLKWPNDLLWHYRKLGGILIEVQGDVMGPSFAVIGIGINLQLSGAVRAEIDQSVTDLNEICGTQIDRNLLLAALLIHLDNVMQDFEQSGLTRLRTEWLAAHAYQDKPVRVLLANGKDQLGTAIGVSADGALLLQTPSGQQLTLNGGEVHLTRCLS